MVCSMLEDNCCCKSRVQMSLVLGCSPPTRCYNVCWLETSEGSWPCYCAGEATCADRGEITVQCIYEVVSNNVLGKKRHQ